MHTIYPCSKLLGMIIDKFGIGEARNASNIIRLGIQQEIDKDSVSSDFVDQVSSTLKSWFYKLLLVPRKCHLATTNF
jgi:hypothetical protein